MKDTKKAAESSTAKDKMFEGFTDEERGAMKERAQELKAAARRGLATRRGRGAAGGRRNRTVDAETRPRSASRRSEPWARGRGRIVIRAVRGGCCGFPRGEFRPE